MAVKQAIVKAQPERWTPEKRRDFLAKLAETANVRASARAVGMSEQGVYKLRAKSPEFRAQWAAALREGYAQLEVMLLERALKGTRKPVFHGGAKIGSVTEYSDRLALTLLNAHHGSVHGAVIAKAPPRDMKVVHAKVSAKLSTMNKRMGGKG